MAGIETLMQATLTEVFGERDAAKRRAAIERTYLPDVEFSDADGRVVGHAALDRKAQGILDGAPDFVFTHDGPARVNHDLGYQAWGFGPEGAPPVVRGMDIALVRDGRIARLYTLLLQD
jgi:hypothetical protein